LIKILASKDRVDNLETMLIDTDQDGVADYLDLGTKHCFWCNGRFKRKIY
jgi:hypothetical protein